MFGFVGTGQLQDFARAIERAARAAAIEEVIVASRNFFGIYPADDSMRVRFEDAIRALREGS
jgi:hypothetical protein